MLPKRVPAAPIYKQMEKLEGLRAELAAALEKIVPSSVDSANKVATLETFEQFAKVYREMLTKGLDADQKRAIMQKFIRKVEVGADSVKIHFIVGETHYGEDFRPNKRRKTAPCCKTQSGAEVAPADFSTFAGSNNLTIGTGRGT